jgi:hypothetical protein
MRLAMGLTVCAFLLVNVYRPAKAEEAAGRFDGSWDTTVSCRNAAGALAYTYQFSSTVKDSVLHGERGIKGKPGWLEIDGTIQSDGTANLNANGLVGSEKHALGERPPGTPYKYQINAKFADRDGTGKRTRQRQCDLTFHKR